MVCVCGGVRGKARQAGCESGRNPKPFRIARRGLEYVGASVRPPIVTVDAFGRVETGKGVLRLCEGKRDGGAGGPFGGV